MQAVNFDQTTESRVQTTLETVSAVHRGIVGWSDRFEVDHPDAFSFREGVAVYFAPGGVPHIFDHESVTQFIGDLKGQPDGN